MWLPYEIWLAIFKWCGPITLLKASGVCRDWLAMTRDDSCWKHHWERAKAIVLTTSPVVCHSGWPLWHQYCTRYLAGGRAADRLKLESLISFAENVKAGIAAIVYPNTPDDHVIWSWTIRVEGVVHFELHAHKETHYLCIGSLQCFNGHRLTWDMKHDVLVNDWNRYYTLTRGSDAVVPAELRAWAVIE
jgi:hypothetical protein